jgi:hypothetical protein
MTNPDEPAPPPVPAGIALVSAFLDGEPVSALALKEALTHRDASDFLVDALVLRHLVAGQPAVESAPRARRVALRLVAAALLAGVVSSAAYALGHRAAVMTAVRADKIEAVVEIPPRAPEPTQVIRLAPGVN